LWQSLHVKHADSDGEPGFPTRKSALPTLATATSKRNILRVPMPTHPSCTAQLLAEKVSVVT